MTWSTTETGFRCDDCGYEGEALKGNLLGGVYEHRKAEHSEVHDFACVHGGKEQTCQDNLKWALEYLSTDRKGALIPDKVTMANFLDSMVWTLNWDYHAAIEGIYNDQWSRVDTRGYTHAKLEPFATYVQCDQVEHGLALTLKLWVERFGAGRSMKEDDDGETGDEGASAEASAGDGGSA